MPSQPPPPIWKTGAEPLEDDMANRGMLPKFRPAMLGLTASVRPSIRPVKASPAPPVPSPPRRGEAAVESEAAIATERILLADDELEMPTADGVGEASTLDRGPVTLPREMVQATPRGRRGNVMQLQFEDETEARPQSAPNRYDALVTPVRLLKADLGVDYDALPSLGGRARYASEGELSQGGPESVTQAAIRESAQVRRVDVYRAPESSSPLVPELGQDEEEFWGRREGSGPRSRPVLPDPPHSYAAPVPAYDDDSQSRRWGEPPPLAPVTVGYPPMEMRGAPEFVTGVQPIRTFTPVPDAWVSPQAQPQGYQPQPQGYLPSRAPLTQRAMPAGYGVPANQVHPYAVQACGAQPTPWPPQHFQAVQPQGHYPPQQPLAQPSNHPSVPQAYSQQRGPAPMPSSRPIAAVAQPVSGQLAPPQSPGDRATKIGRFAWFVAGAAFGIMFAFFATGFFISTGSAKKDSTLRPPTRAAQAPQAPTSQQSRATPMAQAPLVQQQPVQVPLPLAQPPLARPQQAQAPQQQSPPVAFAQTAQQRPQPVAQRPAPPPRAPRSAPPARRPTRPSGDDGPATPAPADLSDLLGAGLKP